MKTCPVCAAIAFDDQKTCYGCLHSFEEGEASTHGGRPSATSVPVQGYVFGASQCEEKCGHNEYGVQATQEIIADLIKGGSLQFVLTLVPSFGQDERLAWNCDVRPFLEKGARASPKHAASA